MLTTTDRPRGWSAIPLTVRYKVRDTTLSKVVDYQVTAGILTIPMGATQAKVRSCKHPFASSVCSDRSRR